MITAALRHTEVQTFHIWKKTVTIKKMNSAVPISYRNAIINHGGM